MSDLPSDKSLTREPMNLRAVYMKTIRTKLFTAKKKIIMYLHKLKQITAKDDGVMLGENY